MDADFLKNLQSTQQREQLESSLQEMSAMLRMYYQALKAQGFGRAEAMALVVSYQQSALAAVMSPGKDG